MKAVYSGDDLTSIKDYAAAAPGVKAKVLESIYHQRHVFSKEVNFQLFFT